jgi:hypothetical protein
MHKYSTGTDGCRILCHQFSTSSLLRLGNCTSRCNTFWQQMKLLRETTLLLSSTDDQGRNTQTTQFPLNTGRWSFTGWWSRRNRSAQWQPRMESRMKRSVASFVLLRTCIYSKKRNGPIWHDGMRDVSSCSAQERILSIANTMALLEATSLFSYRGSSQPLSNLQAR